VPDRSVGHPAGRENQFQLQLRHPARLRAAGRVHQPNEFVDCEQFLAHTKALILFLIRYCGVV
jgi:hypothetical protein